MDELFSGIVSEGLAQIDVAASFSEISSDVFSYGLEHCGLSNNAFVSEESSFSSIIQDIQDSSILDRFTRRRNPNPVRQIGRQLAVGQQTPIVQVIPGTNPVQIPSVPSVVYGQPGRTVQVFPAANPVQLQQSPSVVGGQPPQTVQVISAANPVQFQQSPSVVGGQPAQTVQVISAANPVQLQQSPSAVGGLPGQNVQVIPAANPAQLQQPTPIQPVQQQPAVHPSSYVNYQHRPNQQAVVVVQPQAPMPVTAAGLQTQDYLCFAWFAFIFSWFACCWPFGIVAVVYAHRTNDEKRRGDHRNAAIHSKQAKTFVIVTIVLTAVTLFFFLIIAILSPNTY